MKKHIRPIIAFFLVIFAAGFAFSQKSAPPTPDVVYVPTEQKIVGAMLELAKITKDDTVYDLGCGDGRIVIAAAKEFGANGIGIDISSELIKKAVENARLEGVSDRVKFIEADIFRTDFRRASVVMLYLSPSVNLKLRPRLLKHLRPGTRIVSHDFGMGEWQPEKTITIENATLYLWIVPAKKPKFKND